MMIEAVDGWWLTPECAAVHREAKVAVVADVHLGYEWSRGAGGDCIPAHSLGETLARLGRLLARAEIRELVVAGDLVESRGPCPRTDRDVASLRSWLMVRGVALVAVRGNHDPARLGALVSYQVSGWTVEHGDRPGARSGKRLSGHLHPAIRFESHSFPCFLVGPDRIILPAFSMNAGGVEVGGLDVDRALRCIACAETSLYEFGPVSHVLARSGSRDLGAIGASRGGRRRR